MIDKQVYSFTAPYQLDYNDIPIPDGYVLADDYSEEDVLPILYFYNNVWRVYYNTINIAVCKAEEPSNEPKEPVTEKPSEKPSIENPTGVNNG